MASHLKPSTLVILFFLLLNLSNIITPISSSNVPSDDQLSYWSKNVLNTMPKSLLTKLSPLSTLDSNLFTSLLSYNELPFTSEANFCSRANLACANNVDGASSVRSKSSSDTKSYINQYGDDVAMSSANHQAKIDPFFYFRLSTLDEGKIVHLPDLHEPFPSRSFLPSQIASKISLTTNQLKSLFPESFASPVMKNAIESTLAWCNTPNNNLKAGEIQGCVKSLEEMIDFSKKALGAKRVISLTSKNTQGSGQELIIGSKRQIVSKKTLYCHETFLPFVTFFCHMQGTYQLYSVDLFETGTTNNNNNNNNNVPINTVLAVCHMDTSTWPANHVAFKSLKLSPGKGEICHFYSQIDHAFIGA